MILDAALEEHKLFGGLVDKVTQLVSIGNVLRLPTDKPGTNRVFCSSS